jgi:hypothetical protein
VHIDGNVITVSGGQSYRKSHVTVEADAFWETRRGTLSGFLANDNVTATYLRTSGEAATRSTNWHITPKPIPPFSDI